MKVLGISSSPRPNSNSKYALEKAFEFLNDNGVETEIFDIHKMDIKSCQGCDYCKRNDEAKCVIPDDMQEIYEELKTSDAIVLTSPIYMSQLTAQAKTFMDRLYCYFMSDWVDRYGSKKVLMLVSQGQPGEDLYKENMDCYKTVFEMILNFEFVDSAVLTENNVPGAIKEKPEQIEQAINLCKKLIE